MLGGLWSKNWLENGVHLEPRENLVKLSKTGLIKPLFIAKQRLYSEDDEEENEILNTISDYEEE